MKRIYHSTTGETIWRGEAYTVDGVSASVEAPLHLLEEVQRDQPVYDDTTQRLEPVAPHADLDAGEWVTISWQVVDLTADELSARARSSSRAALRAQWEALPPYIRGPYRDKFEAANRLLDEGDDESAVALIEYAAPAPDFDATQFATFVQVKAAMKAGIEALPG